MLESFRAGGWGMFPILIFGLIALGTALRYAITADGRLRGFLESLARAVIFFSLSGFVTDLLAVGRYLQVENVTGWASIEIAIQGGRESLNTIALGVTLLGLVHLLIAVGRRREDARP